MVHLKCLKIWATPWENLFMSYANNKGADQPAHLLLAAPYICCCRHIKEFLRTKSKLVHNTLVSLKLLSAFVWIVGRHSQTKSNAKQTAFNKNARVFTPQLIDNYLSKQTHQSGLSPVIKVLPLVNKHGFSHLNKTFTKCPKWHGHQ